MPASAKTVAQYAGIVVIGALAMLLLLAIGLSVVYAFGTGFSRNSMVEGVAVAYVRGSANVRACPSDDCELVGTLRQNQQVQVVGTADGQRLPGGDQWTIVKFGREVAYIHEPLLVPETSISEQRRFWSLLSLLTVAVVPFFALLLGKSGAIENLVARQKRGVEVTVLIAVMLAGIIAGALGFWYGHLEHASVNSFLADTFVNLGAGLIGAAITFVLLQSVFSSTVADRAAIEVMQDEQRRAFEEACARLRDTEQSIQRMSRLLEAGQETSVMHTSRVSRVRKWFRRA